jgi:hypothetical protein
MLKRRIRAPAITAVAGITIAAAALVALSTAGAPALSAARAAHASHTINASATDAHAQGVIYSIHRGLVKDCVRIELGTTGLELWDNGAYSPVTLEPAPASCWNLINEFGVDFGGTEYIGYEYQDLRGDCLWDDAGTIYTSPICTDLANYESFFGVHYYDSGANGPGWAFADAYWGPSRIMAQLSGGEAYMVPTSQLAYESNSHLWNFP